MTITRNRIFSGIQPTGKAHLGNYLGAIKQWEKLQNDGECLFCLVDLHAITVRDNAKNLSTNTREMAAILLATGIDPKRSILFQQSAVPAHTSLAWILSCTSRVGWLNRMVQFKEKSGKNREGASVGLLTYPVLQAADILAYQATHVPVGEDQKQHIELARDIAHKFNTEAKSNYFSIPEPIFPKGTARVMSLRNGLAKMSKSDPSDFSRINLSDDTDLIHKKIQKAKTDSDPIPSEPEGLKDRPEAKNLLEIFSSIRNENIESVCRQYGGQGFASFKREMAELLIATLNPITTRINSILSDSTMIDQVLTEGALKASELANPVINKAMEISGFYQPSVK